MPQIASDHTYTYSVKMAHWWTEKSNNDLQIISKPVKSFIRYLYKYCWTDEYGEPITPINVRNYPLLYPFHTDRVLNADMTYPILLYPNGAIFDGMHRLLRAYCQKSSYIDTITIPENVLKKFIIQIHTDELYDIDMIRNRNYKKTIKILFKSRFENKL